MIIYMKTWNGEAFEEAAVAWFKYDNPLGEIQESDKARFLMDCISERIFNYHKVKLWVTSNAAKLLLTEGYIVYEPDKNNDDFTYVGEIKLYRHGRIWEIIIKDVPVHVNEYENLLIVEKDPVGFTLEV